MTAIAPVNKVRKGEIVAIEIQHSSTDAKMRTTRYVRFVLATVTQANRQGLARRVAMAGQTHSVEVARLGTCFALKTYQTEAQILAGLTKWPGVEYETREELQAAILGAPLLSAAS